MAAACYRLKGTGPGHPHEVTSTKETKQDRLAHGVSNLDLGRSFPQEAMPMMTIAGGSIIGSQSLAERVAER